MNYFAMANRGQPKSHWTPHHQRAINELWGMIEPIKAKRVLDCGCGQNPSPTLQMLREHRLESCGLDIDAGDVKGDMHFMPFRDDGFDLVLSCHSLEHSLSPAIALMEMRRVAKYVLIVVPEARLNWALWQGHWSIFPQANWEILFFRVGLKIIKFSKGDFSQVRETGDFEWRWLLERSEPFAGPFQENGAPRELPTIGMALGK